MMMVPTSVRIYLASAPVDMRCSFDGLTARETSLLAADPFSGHLFVFRNRRGDRVKIGVPQHVRRRPLQGDIVAEHLMGLPVLRLVVLDASRGRSTTRTRLSARRIAE